MNTTTATSPTFKFYACFKGQDYYGNTIDAAHPEAQPMRAVLSGEQYATREEAEAVAALLPKYAKARAQTCGHSGRDEAGAFISWTTYFVQVPDFTFAANGANGGYNETAVTRLHKTLKALAAAGCTVEFTSAYTNCYASMDALDAALARQAEAVQG